jgi:hypothetical protein
MGAVESSHASRELPGSMAIRSEERAAMRKALNMQHVLDRHVLDRHEAFRVATVDAEGLGDGDAFCDAMALRVASMDDPPHVTVVTALSSPRCLERLGAGGCSTYNERTQVGVYCASGRATIRSTDVYDEDFLEVILGGALEGVCVLACGLDATRVGHERERDAIWRRVVRYCREACPRDVVYLYVCGSLVSNRLSARCEQSFVDTVHGATKLRLPMVVPDCDPRRPLNRFRGYGMLTRHNRAVADQMVLGTSRTHERPDYADNRALDVGGHWTMVMARFVWRQRDRNLPMCAGVQMTVFRHAQYPPGLEGDVGWISRVRSYESDRDMFLDDDMALVDPTTRKANAAGRLALAVRQVGQAGGRRSRMLEDTF